MDLKTAMIECYRAGIRFDADVCRNPGCACKGEEMLELHGITEVPSDHLKTVIEEHEVEIKQFIGMACEETRH